MTPEEIAVKLEGHDHEIGSLKHRMEEAEKTSNTIHQLATSVALMAEQLKTMNSNITKLNSKVDALEAEPAKIRTLYRAGRITLDGVRKAVVDGLITEAEYTEITGKAY